MYPAGQASVTRRLRIHFRFLSSPLLPPPNEPLAIKAPRERAMAAQRRWPTSTLAAVAVAVVVLLAASAATTAEAQSARRRRRASGAGAGPGVPDGAAEHVGLPDVRAEREQGAAAGQAVLPGAGRAGGVQPGVPLRAPLRRRRLLRHRRRLLPRPRPPRHLPRLHPSRLHLRRQSITSLIFNLINLPQLSL